MLHAIILGCLIQLFQVDHVLLAISCNYPSYTSREYQVILNPKLFTSPNSFSDGVNLVLDYLGKIENDALINFTLVNSSLSINNESLVDYMPENVNDMKIPVSYKSRIKPGKPADIVFKISNSDPALVYRKQFRIADEFINSSKTKFELDTYATNGKTSSHCSYAVSVDLLETSSSLSSINISSIFPDASSFVTYSDSPIIIRP
ncbi:unnamed protein product, partial [Didymodactylos carnosus]